MINNQVHSNAFAFRSMQAANSKYSHPSCRLIFMHKQCIELSDQQFGRRIWSIIASNFPIPIRNEWSARRLALVYHTNTHTHTTNRPNAPHNHHYHNIIKLSIWFRKMHETLIHLSHRPLFVAVHLFAMHSLFALLSNYCSVSVFVARLTLPRISLFIIRHFIMRECIGTVLLVDKQLKSDAERPSLLI